MDTTRTYADRSLFQQIADGDEEAFKSLFRHYTKQLRPFIFSIDKSDELVDEVIQETMIKVWLNRDKLPEILDPKAWICRIAANCCYRHRRRLLTDRKATTQFHGSSTGEHNEVLEKIDLTQLKKTVRTAIDLLPAQRRKVYLLRREEGLTVPAIAAQLGLSVNTVRNTLAVANTSIREYLREQGYSTAMLLLLLRWL